MDSQEHKRSKNRQKQTSAFSNASDEKMFQPRPFVVQQAAENLHKSDFKTSVMRSQRYGHHLGKINPVSISRAQTVQPKLKTGNLPASMHKQEDEQVLTPEETQTQQNAHNLTDKQSSYHKEPANSGIVQQARIIRESPTPSSTNANKMNIKKLPKGNVKVYRVEVEKFNDKFSHLNIDKNGNGNIYNPKQNAGQYTGKGKKTPPKDTNTKKYSNKFLKGRENQPAGNMTFMNFGRPQRALNFYNQKSNNPNEQGKKFAIKSFEVPSEVAKRIQKDSVHESLARRHPNQTINVDRVTPNQFGLPQRHVELINQTMIPGSAKLEDPKKMAGKQGNKKSNNQNGNQSGRQNNTQNNKKKGKKPYGKKR